jgi:DNA-directed RNA polymerase subunit alpha
LPTTNTDLAEIWQYLIFRSLDKVIMIDSTDFEGKFQIRPLEPGYGLTVAPLRRVLLSALEGYAITSVSKV